MAKKASPKRTQFKKGLSGNPHGRPPVPAELRAIRAMTNEEMLQSLSLLINSTPSDLRARLEDPTTTTLQAIIINSLLSATESRPVNTESLFDRLFGKTKERIEHSGLKPAILLRQDGTEVVFTNKKDEEE